MDYNNDNNVLFVCVISSNGTQPITKRRTKHILQARTHTHDCQESVEHECLMAEAPKKEGKKACTKSQCLHTVEAGHCCMKEEVPAE